MSSTPTSAFLSASSTPVIRSSHRHKRSGAISGDFDLAGLGLLSPKDVNQKTHHTSHYSNPTYLSPNDFSHNNLRRSLFTNGTELEISTRHFNFSNEEDFTNIPLKEGFSFPSLHAPNTVAKGLESGPRGVGNKLSILNSPIRLKNKGSFSSTNGVLRLFLTDDTSLDENNVPDALIDLDRVLSASSAKEGTETSDADKGRDPDGFDFFDGGGVIPPSRLSSSSNASSSSPYSSPAYLKQPIREPANDAIKEEEINEDTDPCFEVHSSYADANLDGHHGEEMELNMAPHGGVNLYSASLNSSASSLPHSHRQVRREPSGFSIERISSNTSKEASYSFFGVNGTPTPKRFSAKANRYQAFYEQSTKISSSLKMSSSESIPFIPPFHLESSLAKEKELRPLEHSLSLPSLKSGKNRVSSAQSLESRPRDVTLTTGIFKIRSNVSDYVCVSCSPSMSPDTHEESPVESCAKSLCQVHLLKQNLPLTFHNGVPHTPALGNESLPTPKTGTTAFGEDHNLAPGSQSPSDLNFGTLRSATPTIVVSSGVDTNNLAPQSGFEFSPLPQICKQNLSNDIHNEKIPKKKLASQEHATQKSNSLPRKVAPKQSAGEDQSSRFVRQTSHTRSNINDTSMSEASVKKSKRISNWFKRMK